MIHRFAYRIVMILTLLVPCGSTLRAQVPPDRPPTLDVAKWVKGDAVNLAAGTGNKIFVIAFWATWCEAGKSSLARLNELQSLHKDKGVTVLAITDEEEAVVRPFVEKMGSQMDFTVGIDNQSKTTDAYMEMFDVDRIPYSLVVDKSGVVVWHGSPMDGLDAVLSQVVTGTYTPPTLEKLVEAETKFEPAGPSFGEFVGGLLMIIFVAALISWAINSLVMWVVINVLVGNRGEGPILRCFGAVFLLNLVGLGALLVAGLLFWFLPIGRFMAIPIGLSIWWRGSVAILDGLFPEMTAAGTVMFSYLLLSMVVGWGVNSALKPAVASSVETSLKEMTTEVDKSIKARIAARNADSCSYYDKPEATPTPPPGQGKIADADKLIIQARALWDKGDKAGSLAAAEQALVIYQTLPDRTDVRISNTEKMITAAKSMLQQPAK